MKRQKCHNKSIHWSPRKHTKSYKNHQKPNIQTMASWYKLMQVALSGLQIQKISSWSSCGNGSHSYDRRRDQPPHSKCCLETERLGWLFDHQRSRKHQQNQSTQKLLAHVGSIFSLKKFQDHTSETKRPKSRPTIRGNSMLHRWATRFSAMPISVPPSVS